MKSRLVGSHRGRLISPLIDVVFNAMAAMFVFLMIYMIVVQPKKPLQFVHHYLPSACLMSRYEAAIAVNGGVGKYQFSIDGELPSGLDYDPDTGLIYGNPFSNEASLYSRVGKDKLYTSKFKVKVQDSSKSSIDGEFSISVYPVSVPFHPIEQPLDCQVKSGSLPEVYVGQPVDFSLGIVGGIEAYKVERQGLLPPGVKFENGRIFGVPLEANEYSFGIVVTDQQDYYKILSELGFKQPVEIIRRYKWRVLPPPTIPKLQITTPAELPEVRIGASYPFQFACTGGKEPISWKKIKGTIPDGLSFSPDGRLTGKPSGPRIGDFNFTVEVTDALGKTVTKDFILSVRPAPRPLRF